MKIVGSKHTQKVEQFDVLCSCRRRIWHWANIAVVKCPDCWWQEPLAKLQDPHRLPLYLEHHLEPTILERVAEWDEYWQQVFEERVAIILYHGTLEGDVLDSDAAEVLAYERTVELMQRPTRCHQPKGSLVRS